MEIVYRYRWCNFFGLKLLDASIGRTQKYFVRFRFKYCEHLCTVTRHGQSSSNISS